MPKVLSPIERRIYNFVVDYLKRETYQPSIREIGSRFGIRSTKTVTEYLQSLQRKGYLDRTRSRSRALKILGLDLSPETYTIPVYRDPIPDHWEEVDAQYDLDRGLACSPDCFLVRINGDHLQSAGILDGDLLLVEPCDKPAPEDTRVSSRDGRIELERNSSNNPEDGGSGGGNVATLDRLLGVARGVVRTFRDGS